MDNKSMTSTPTRTVLRHSSSVTRPVLEMILIKHHLLLPSIQHGEQTSPWSSLGNRLMHRPSMMDISAVVVGMTLYRRDVRLLLLLLLLLLLRGRVLRLKLARTLMRWRTVRGRLVPGRTTIGWLICVLGRYIRLLESRAQGLLLLWLRREVWTIRLTLCRDRGLGSSIVSLTMGIVIVYRLSGDNGWHGPYRTWCAVMRFIRGRRSTPDSRWAWTVTMGIGRPSMMGLRCLSGIAGVVCAGRRRESCRLDRRPVLLLHRWLRWTDAKGFMVCAGLVGAAIVGTMI
jgi:hypothetical protein